MLIASTGGGVLGKVFYYKEREGNYIADSHVTVVRDTLGRVCPKYLYYFLLPNYSLINGILAEGSTNQTELQRDWLLNLWVPFPPLDEQQAIAAYIDDKSRRIETFIRKKQQFIELLKEQRSAIINHAVTKGLNPDVPMKDSGIAWLGEVPGHWEVRRLKTVSKSIKTGSTPKTEDLEKHFEGGEVNWFTPGDIKDLFISSSNRKVTQQAIDDEAVTLFEAKSILVVGIGATLGKVSLIQMAGGSNQQINAVTLNDSVHPEYGLYFLSGYENVLKSMSNAATLAILTQSDLKDMKFLLPPLDEQMKIIKHIVAETGFINEAISKAQKEIDLIKEYRESLIAEAVMGKLNH